MQVDKSRVPVARVIGIPCPSNGTVLAAVLSDNASGDERVETVCQQKAYISGLLESLRVVLIARRTQKLCLTIVLFSHAAATLAYWDGLLQDYSCPANVPRRHPYLPRRAVRRISSSDTGKKRGPQRDKYLDLEEERDGRVDKITDINR